jgi:hypothetical protein
MPDQLFAYYIENPLVNTSMNSGIWADNGCMDRDRNMGNLKRWHLKWKQKMKVVLLRE